MRFREEARSTVSDRWLVRLLTRLGLAACLVVGLVGQTAAQPPRVDRVQLGFDGHYRVGCWTHVRLTLVGGNQDTEVELRLLTLDGDGTEAAYGPAGETIPLAAEASVQVSRYVKFGRVQGSLTVELFSQGQLVARRRLSTGEFPAPRVATQRIIASLGHAATLDEATRLRLKNRNSVTFAHVETVEDMPERWLGYESLDTLLICTADNELLDAMSGPQLEALQRWVSLGGRVILSVGRRGGELFGGPSGGLRQLAPLVPGTAAEVATLRNTSALESYSGATQRLDLGQGRDAGIPLTLLQQLRGTIEISEKGLRGPLPLILRSAHGFGEVLFLAFDLNHPQLFDWVGRTRLTARLLSGGQLGADPDADQPQSRRVAHVGYQDLVGQLRSSLDRFSDVMLVPFYLVAGLICAYILLVGPADFLCLRKLGRLPWTWVTLPVLVIVFAALGGFLHARLKPQTVRINQVDVVDIDLASSLVRGSMWAHLYSPSTQTYDLNLEPTTLVQEMSSQSPQAVLSWQGLPGNGLGGLSTASTVTPFAPPYQVTAQADLLGTPIQVTSTKAVLGQWWSRIQPLEVDVLKADSDKLLEGLVRNPLPIELTECVVLYENWAFPLARVSQILAPGQATELKHEKPRNLEWRLTGRDLRDADDIRPWNENNLDVARILEIMMFHQAAGGDVYTRLTHRYQRFVDLSHQLKNNRAILVGRAQVPPTELLIDASTPADVYDDRWIFVRILFPVE